MNHNDLDGLKVAIIATDNFEEDEMTEPRKALDKAGADTLLVTLKNKSIWSIRHDKPGETFEADLALEDVSPNDFDAIMLPGGALNADKLRSDESVLDFVRQFDREGKPIAFICHAPWVIISAGIARNRHFTGYHTIKDDIINAGANYEDAEVIRDRNFVSSRQPSDIPAFNREMIALFAKHVPSHA